MRVSLKDLVAEIPRPRLGVECGKTWRSGSILEARGSSNLFSFLTDPVDDVVSFALEVNASPRPGFPLENHDEVYAGILEAGEEAVVADSVFEAFAGGRAVLRSASRCLIEREP